VLKKRQNIEFGGITAYVRYSAVERRGRWCGGGDTSDHDGSVSAVENSFEVTETAVANTISLAETAWPTQTPWMAHCVKSSTR